jgi:hypothetical protein
MHTSQPEWYGDIIRLKSSTNGSRPCYMSKLKHSKDGCKVLAKGLTETEAWLHGARRHCSDIWGRLSSYTVERVVFIPLDELHDDITFDENSDLELTVPVSCRGGISCFSCRHAGLVCIERKGPGEKWRQQFLKLKVPPRFRFRTVVLLPSWMRGTVKREQDLLLETAKEWFRYGFVDCFFIVDITCAVYLSFSPL